LNSKESDYNRRPTEAEILNDDAFFKSRLKWQNKEKIRRILRYSFAVVVSAAFLVLCALTFFRVSTINVSGNAIYSVEEIIAASGIEKGRNLYELNHALIEKNIILKYPFIKEVELNREIPSTVELVITEDIPAYYTDVYGEYLVLSEDLRVMAIYESREELLSDNGELILIVTPKISTAIVGEPIRFAKDSSETLIKDIIACIENSHINGEVNVIDFSDKFDIVVVCRGNRFRLQMGSYGKDFLKYLNFAYEVYNDDKIADGYANISLKYGTPAVVTLEKSKFEY